MGFLFLRDLCGQKPFTAEIAKKSHEGRRAATSCSRFVRLELQRHPHGGEIHEIVRQDQRRQSARLVIDHGHFHYPGQESKKRQTT